MRIVIQTDLEGISGVCVFQQTREMTTSYYQDARRLLMADVSAAVDGCVDGGATEVMVVDNHGGTFNFVPELMSPKAKYLTGRKRPHYREMEKLYRSYDAVILLGYHAMAGTPDGILRHTQSSIGGNRYWYNGREFGEIGQTSAAMGCLGLPVVMISGDAAGCREARAFLGQDIVAVSVKEGYTPEYGLLLAPEAAHALIRAGAKEAMTRIGVCKPFEVAVPVHGRLVFPDKSTADNFKPLRAKRVDDYAFETDFDNVGDLEYF